MLCTQCRGIGPHLSGSGKSHGFSRVAAGTRGMFSSSRGVTFKNFFYSVTSGLLSSYDGHLRNLNYVWQDNTDASGGEAGDQGSLSSWNSDMRIPIHSKKSQASSPFEALNSVCLSRCQRDVIPPVQMRRRPTAFSRVSTVYSYIPSSCEMKEKPEFKSLQGNTAFF